MVKLYHDYASIHVIKDKRMIGKGKVQEELYLKNIIDDVCVHALSIQRNRCFDHLWNICPLPRIQISHTCSVFPLYKQKRLAFTSLNNVSSKAYYLIYCDTRRPYDIDLYKITYILLPPTSQPTQPIVTSTFHFFSIFFDPQHIETLFFLTHSTHLPYHYFLFN